LVFGVWGVLFLGPAGVDDLVPNELSQSREMFFLFSLFSVYFFLSFFSIFYLFLLFPQGLGAPRKPTCGGCTFSPTTPPVPLPPPTHPSLAFHRNSFETVLHSYLFFGAACSHPSTPPVTGSFYMTLPEHSPVACPLSDLVWHPDAFVSVVHCLVPLMCPMVPPLFLPPTSPSPSSLSKWLTPSILSPNQLETGFPPPEPHSISFPKPVPVSLFFSYFSPL